MDALDSTAGWNEACDRVEGYLRAHGLADHERVLRLTLELVALARAEKTSGSSNPPVEIAMGLAIEHVDAWFSRLGSESADAALSGRSGYFTGRAWERNGDAFLLDPPPEDLVREISASGVHVAPDLDLASLSRADIDYGPMEDLAKGTWEQFSWGHVLRAFVIWLLVFFAAYAGYLRFFQ